MARSIKGITIEIEGKTSGLVKSLNDANKAIKDTEYQLRQVNKALKLDPGNADLIKAKQNALAKEIEETKKKLDAEKQAAQDAAEALEKGAITQGEYDALQADIALTTSKLKDLEKEAKQSSSVLGQQMQAAGKNIRNVGEGIATVGEKLLPISGAITAAGTAAVGIASSFESEMSKVAAISGATGDDLQALTDKAREMGATTQFSAQESAQALEYMAMAGWKTEDMMSGIAGVLSLAAASGADLATTSDIVTDAMTAMGYSADQAGHFADVLAATSTNANTNVEMLGESFKYVAPLAGSMGYSIEDVATALGLMANSGIKASSAGTALRTLLTNMAKPTEGMQNAMDELGVSLEDGEGNMKSLAQIMADLRSGFGDLKMAPEEFAAEVDSLNSALEDGTITQNKYDEAMDELTQKAFGAEGALKAEAAAALAGKQGLSGLMAIVNASDADFEKLTKSIYGSEGAASKMASVMQDNLGGDVKKLKSALEELAIAFGELIIPVVRDVVAVVQEMVNDLNALDGSTKKTIVTIGAVAAALGPVLLIVGKVVSAIGAITSAVGAALPIITTAVAGIGSAFAAAGTAVAGVATTIGGFIATALVPILPIIAAVGAAIAAVIVVIKNWDSIVELAGMVFEEFRDLLLKAGNAIKTGLSNAFKAAGNAIKGVFNNLKTWASNVRTALVQTFTALGDAIKARATGIGTAVVDGVSKAVNFIKELPSKAYTWGTDMIDSFINGIKKKIVNLQEALRGAAQKVKDFLGFSEPKYGPLADFHTFAPDMMDLFAKGIRDSTSVVTQALQASANQTASAVQTDYTGVLRQIATNTGATSANTGRATGDINIALKVGSQQFGRAVLKAGQLNAYRTGGH